MVRKQGLRVYRSGKAKNSPDFKLGELKHSTEVVMLQFRELNCIIEDLLRHQAQKYLQDRTTGKGEKERNKVRYFDIEYINLAEIYPSRVRVGVFLSLYSMMEKLLIDTCTDVFVTKQSFLPKPRNSSFVKWVATYLSRYVQVAAPSFFTTEAKTLNDVRNAFAHNNGVLNTQKGKDKDFEKFQQGTLAFKDIRVAANQLELGKDFIEDVINRISAMFDDLFKKGSVYARNLK
jgi:hypothetical protein